MDKAVDTFYLVYYKQREGREWVDANSVLAEHPTDFIMRWQERGVQTVVMFYAEISKEKYDKAKGQIG